MKYMATMPLDAYCRHLSQRACDSDGAHSRQIICTASTPKEFVEMPAEELEDHIRVIGFILQSQGN
jgi:hypothetical protein